MSLRTRAAGTALLLAAAAAALLGTATSPASTGGVLPRATADRTDEAVGPQIHVIYAVPKDRPDGELDTNGTIWNSIQSWIEWLDLQDGDRALVLDTSEGDLDITYVPLKQNESYYSTAAHPVVQIAEELSADGFDVPDKIYLVYYDGSYSKCGDGGSRYPTIFVRGCPTTTLGNYPPGYADFVTLHELVHSLGFVPRCAPHSDSTSHVSDSDVDLMWGNGVSPWGDLSKMTLDVNRDDYFDAFIPGCPDLSGSRYLHGGGASLTVGVANEGGAHGKVTGTSDGHNSDGVTTQVDCSTDACSAWYDTWPVQTVTLTAVPATPADGFAGWQGACEGRAETCTVRLDASRSVQATFEPKPPVTVRVTLSGSGTVASRPPGISCPRRCSASFPYASTVTLTARPARGWRLGSFSGGGCIHRGSSCTIATLGPPTRAVRVSFAHARSRRG